MSLGTVTALNATVNVCYEARGPFRCVKLATFKNQILIQPGTFSAGGDSGSLIVTVNGNQPVGLLFAGSSTHTIANPIDAVLSRFQVTIDVTDDDHDNGTVNTPPTASFTYEVRGLEVTFVDTSSDNDAFISGRSWDFDDGVSSAETNPTHTYAAGGTHSEPRLAFSRNLAIVRP